jgi:hypothetical protein
MSGAQGIWGVRENRTDTIPYRFEDRAGVSLNCTT